MSRLGLTVLVNDVAPPDTSLVAEHGFAALVEIDGLRLLFDAGQQNAIATNAAHLGVDLTRLDIIAISHGHYDHIGGLPAVLAGLPEPIDVYLGAGTFVPKISTRSDPQGVAIGAPVGADEIAGLGGRTIELTRPHWLTDTALLTGPIPRPLPIESAANFTFRTTPGGERVPDATPEDQALVVKTGSGLIVISGCGHAGLANTVHYARQLTGERRVRAFVGGTHLVAVSDAQLPSVLTDLERLDVARWIVGHCTGRRAEQAFVRAMPGGTEVLEVGTRIEFDDEQTP